MERPANFSPNPQPTAEAHDAGQLTTVMLADTAAKSLDEILRDALRAVRLHLGMAWPSCPSSPMGGAFSAKSTRIWTVRR